MSEDRVVLAARVPEELKDLVDADTRTNQDVIEAALWREFGGERLGALERRIEEKKRRISTIESERNERERELEQERKELEALQSKLETQKESTDKTRRVLLRKLKRVPDDPEHPLVQDVADELDISPEEAIERSKEV